MLLLLLPEAATTVLLLGHLLLEGAGEGDGVVGGGPGQRYEALPLWNRMVKHGYKSYTNKRGTDHSEVLPACPSLVPPPGL